MEAAALKEGTVCAMLRTGSGGEWARILRVDQTQVGHNDDHSCSEVSLVVSNACQPLLLPSSPSQAFLVDSGGMLSLSGQPCVSLPLVLSQVPALAVNCSLCGEWADDNLVLYTGVPPRWNCRDKICIACSLLDATAQKEMATRIFRAVESFQQTEQVMHQLTNSYLTRYALAVQCTSFPTGLRPDSAGHWSREAVTKFSELVERQNLCALAVGMQRDGEQRRHLVELVDTATSDSNDIIISAELQQMRYAATT